MSMKKRILDYRTKVDNILKDNYEDGQNMSGGHIDWEKVTREHLVQISFFQHERLVHLIVTALVAVLFIICFGIAMITEVYRMFIPAMMLFILLIPYISHYYLLENEVQKMYEQYDRLVEKKMHIFPATVDNILDKIEAE